MVTVHIHATGLFDTARLEGRSTLTGFGIEGGDFDTARFAGIVGSLVLPGPA